MSSAKTFAGLPLPHGGDRRHVLVEPLLQLLHEPVAAAEAGVDEIDDLAVQGVEALGEGRPRRCRRRASTVCTSRPSGLTTVVSAD